MMRIYSFLFSLFVSLSLLAQDSGVPLSDVAAIPNSPFAIQQLTQPLSIPSLILEQKFNQFLKLGVPAPALKRSLEFLIQAHGRTLMLKGRNEFRPLPLKNDRYMAIADFSLPSTEKRLYLLDLKNGTLEKHYVSHGKESGFKWAQKFSNNFDSKQTSLGFYLTGELYSSQAFGGTAMKVYGMEATNDNAYARYIVMHQAAYATPEFIEERKKDPKDTARLGRSHGCFALDPEVAPEVIDKLKGGALIYAYTKGAEKLIEQANQEQEAYSVDPSTDTGVDTEEEITQRSQRSAVKKAAVKEKKQNPVQKTTLSR